MSDWSKLIEYHEEPVTLHSGGRSHYLVRADLIFEDEELRESILRCWRYLLPSTGLDILAVPEGGIRWAEAYRDELVSQDIQVYRLDLDIVHLLSPSKSVPLVVLDDVTTTGASLLSVPAATHRLVVVDRRVPGQANFEKEVLSWARIPLPLI